MLIVDIMLPGVHTISPNDSVKDAVTKMIELKRGAMVVGNKNKIEGIISERDLLRKVVAKNLSSEKTPVKNIMTKNVLTISSTSTPERALKIMEENKIRHLPVIDDRGNYVGILSIRDLMSAVTNSIEEENSKLAEYIVEYNFLGK